MTKSEKICNEIGAKYFFKDFVYEKLKYFNKDNNKVELCDALFEYSTFYVPVQIKERTNSSRTEKQWLKDIVYTQALMQIKNTIKSIRNDDIIVYDMYQQKVELNKKYSIFPIIVFDNDNVNDYQKVIFDNDCVINVFKLEDYCAMMETIIHPYDICYYLQERVKYLTNANDSKLIVGIGNKQTQFAIVESEKGFAEFFSMFIYDRQKEKYEAAMTLLQIIEKFKKHQIKYNPNYKTVLKLLQMVEPNMAFEFMSRFNYAKKCAYEDKFDYLKAIRLQCNGKNISIVFFSIGREKRINQNHYKLLLYAKKLKSKADAVLIISFIGHESNRFENEWIYNESKYVANDKCLHYFESMGLYNGSLNYESYQIFSERYAKLVE